MDPLGYTSSEDSDTEEQPAIQENEFVPRPYQLELYEKAKEKNSILVLGTGSGKTFISILLIKEFGEAIRGLVKDGYKRTVFVVNTVPLVHQQHKAICNHTAFKVGKYEGSMGVDIWNEEKWEEEIENNEVLVLSAQILVDMILHARLRIQDINLIIMDECHHATGKHPMREIMRAYIDEDKNNRPRIVGLTACIIHKRVDAEKISKEMECVEKVMDSTLETATDQTLVKQYTTKPEEVIIGYSKSAIEDGHNITAYDDLIAEIESKYENIKENENVDDIGAKDVKNLKKIVRNIKNAQTDLGPWCGMQALEYEIEDIKDKVEREDNPAMAGELLKLCDSLKVIYDRICDGPVGSGNPRDFVTPKVERLLELLVSCRTVDLHCLIFVKQRSTAKILYDLLQKIKLYEGNFDYLKPAYVVGSNQSQDIDLAKLELKKQKETLTKFRKGEFNAVVSTSVLEEGIDVRVCNVVIRFDPPETFRSYVQSRGRARDNPSRYIFFSNAVDGMKKDIVSYKEMEHYLQARCHDRQHPDEEDIIEDFRNDELLPPYVPYGQSGPKVTMNSALGLINKYCQSLPQDQFTKLSAVYKVIKVSRGKDPPYFKCYLKLPVSSLLKEAQWGKPQENRDLAKRSAAINTCQKLHEVGELNRNLLPISIKNEDLLQDLINIPDEAMPMKSQGKMGSRKCRQVYEKDLCSAYKNLSSYFLYAIHIEHTKKNPNGPVVSSSNSSSHLGLLVSGPICLSTFPLYSDKFGEVVVTFECLNENYKIDNLTMKNIENFHKVVFEISLGLPDNMHEFKDEKLPLLILPLREYAVDLELLQEVTEFHTLKSKKPQRSDQQRFVFCEHIYSDAVVIPWYDSKRELYVVTAILDQNPCSVFPENKNCYSTYKDYYKKKYGIEICNDKQLLLEAKHAPRGLSLFKPVEMKPKKMSKKPALVPELCWTAPFKASLLWQMILLPSILHRNNMLNLCHEFGNCVIPHSVCSLQEMEILNYDWPKFQIEEVMGHGHNFCVALNHMERKLLHPLMILNALTLKSAYDAFDMEQLEILGDSFLKFFCGHRIFLGDSNVHEGKLTQKRSILVSNKTLYVQAWKKGIPKLIQGTKFVAVENAFLHGFQIKQVYEEQLLKQRVPANQWHTVKIRDGKIVQDAVGQDDEKQEDCYNPWTHHQVADKSVADVVEALIGVYLLTGGPKRAIKFLKWLELPVPEDGKMPHDALITQNKQNKDYVEKTHKKFCFDRLERTLQYQFQEQSFLLQALTHPSYVANRATESYQRLEFLGDAVLDYLITGHIYSKFQAYSPGKITDLRSYLVNNETLAKAAIKHSLQKYLLHMSPKLQFSIDSFIELVQSGETDFMLEKEAKIFEDIEVPKALGDIIESLIGAVYLDCKGNLQRTWEFIHHLMGDFLVDKVENIPINPVRQVYELDAAAEFSGSPNDHDYEMTLTVCEHTFVGKGKNKRVAKLAAAKIALKHLKPQSFTPT